MLSARYRADGRAVLRLNPVQLRARAELAAKIADGTYAMEATPCPVCGGSELLPLAGKDRYGVAQPVGLCTGCGLVQSNPHLTAAAYAAFYDREYRPLYVGDEAPSQAFFAGQRAHGERLLHLLARHRPRLAGGWSQARVVEVGCGAGGILAAFAARGANVIGCDLGSAYLAWGRQHHGLDLRHGDLASLRLDRPADLVVYHHVLEHVIDPVAELRRAAGVLAPGGCLLIVVPGIHNIERSYASDLLRLLQSAHVWHFSQASLTNLVHRAGLRVCHADEGVDLLAEPSSEQSPPLVNVASDSLARLRRDERGRLMPWRVGMRWLRTGVERARRLASRLLRRSG